MFKRLLTLPLDGSSSIFLFGPRGTGKTSYIRATLPESLYIDLLESNSYRLLSANPSYLEKLIPTQYKDWIIIGEVQKIPELLNEVHRLIAHKNMRFILTGSSARSLRRQGVNLLAGRALRYTMHPLVIQEIGELFDLRKALEYGLLPAAVTHKDPARYLEAYVHTYVQEEVIQEGLTRKSGAFNQFLEAASFSQGQVLNMSEIGKELSLNRLLVTSYFEILEDLLLSVRIPPFTLRAKRKLIAHKKFYLFDTGVYRAARPRGPLDRTSELDGAGLETLFLQSVSAINDYYNLGYKIFFWRTQTGLEVDFVLYGPKGIHAFEIKHSSSVTSKSLKGLRAFKEEYPQASVHLLFLGSHKEYHDDITVLPFEAALKELPSLLSSVQSTHGPK
jgi:uncharacterized protein